MKFVFKEEETFIKKYQTQKKLWDNNIGYKVFPGRAGFFLLENIPCMHLSFSFKGKLNIGPLYFSGFSKNFYGLF